MEAHQILVFMLSSAFLSGIAPTSDENNEVLPAEWSFWLDLSKKQKGLSKEEYLRGLTELQSFEDTQAFKARWEEVAKQANAAQPPMAIHLFPRGITPSWEDPANSTGGKYVMALDDETPAAILKIFLTLSVLLVCGKFAAEQNVCGAVLSLREDHTALLQLWTRSLPGRRQQEAARAQLAHMLQLCPAAEQQIRFAPHPTARKPASSAGPAASRISPPVSRARSHSGAPAPVAVAAPAPVATLAPVAPPLPHLANPRVRSYAAALSGLVANSAATPIELLPAEPAVAPCVAPVEAEPLAPAPAALSEADISAPKMRTVEAAPVQEPVVTITLAAPAVVAEAPVLVSAPVAAPAVAARESKKQKRRKHRQEKSDSESASPSASDAEPAPIVAAPVAAVSAPLPAVRSAVPVRSWLACSVVLPALVAAASVSAVVVSMWA